jgi:hypothetical protein
MKITSDTLLEIITEASYRLHSEIRIAYKQGNLEGYLDSIGMIDLLPPDEEELVYDTLPDGKILIFGDSQLNAREIYGCLKEYGLAKERIELHLGYEEAKKYNFRKLQYNPNYRLILFGPIPHSGLGKEDSTSIITNLQNTDGYPKIISLSDGHKLKMTKSNLKSAIEQQIDCGYLAV